MNAYVHHAVFYASTGGTTRHVAEIIAAQFPAEQTRLFDLRDDIPSSIFLPALRVAIFGTPSYGVGDCHSLWHDKAQTILSIVPQHTPLALFCLGDARGHGASFAGGLEALDRLIGGDRRRIGATCASTHTYQHSPSERDGTFNGLVLQYRSQRRASIAAAASWAAQLADEIRLPQVEMS